MSFALSLVDHLQKNELLVDLESRLPNGLSNPEGSSIGRGAEHFGVKVDLLDRPDSVVCAWASISLYFIVDDRRNKVIFSDRTSDFFCKAVCSLFDSIFASVLVAFIYLPISRYEGNPLRSRP